MHSFTIFEPVHCSTSVLTVAVWPAYRFLRRQVRVCYSHLFKDFLQFVIIHTVKGFKVVKETGVDIFLEFSCFFCDLTDGNLISGSSFFSKSSLYIWKFSFHVLLKRGLKDFEHYLASMWNEHSCMIVWTFFGIAVLWDWSENWSFSRPVAATEFSQFADILYAILGLSGACAQ